MHGYTHYKHNRAYRSGSGCSPCHITKHQEALTPAPGSLPCLRRGLGSSGSVCSGIADSLAPGTRLLPRGAATRLYQRCGLDRCSSLWGGGTAGGGAVLCVVGGLAASLVSTFSRKFPNCPRRSLNAPRKHNRPGASSSYLEVRAVSSNTAATKPHVAPEHLKCDWSKPRSALHVKHTPVPKTKYNNRT